MFEVQETLVGDHVGSPDIIATGPGRVLEGPSGLGLYRGKVLLAKASGARTWAAKREDNHTFRLWHFDSWDWQPVPAMQLLQGKELTQVLGGAYSLISQQARPLSSPFPGLDQLWLVEHNLSEAADIAAFSLFLVDHVRPVLQSLLEQ